MAVKDSIGGWKDNAFVFKQPKACSSLKNVLGAAWTQIMDGWVPTMQLVLYPGYKSVL